MMKIFPDSNFSEPGQKYSHMQKISPGGLPVSSINFVHTNIYIYTCIYATEHVDTWNMLTSTAVIVNMFQVSTRSAAYTHTYIYTIKTRLKYVYIYVYMFRID